METGQQLSLWAIRIALVVWFTFACAAITGGDRYTNWRRLRLLWTMATIAYLIHVLSAFAFFHNWDHAGATRHTAEVTARTTGIDWGGGIWFNHLFTLICVLQTVVWWTHPRWINQRRGLADVLVYGFCLFIGFNAAVVFVGGWVRWLSLGMFGCLTILYLRADRRP